MSRIFISGWRQWALIVVFALGFSAVLYRLHHLQLLHREAYRQYFEDSRRLTVRMESRRGDILDARGSLLATTRPVYRVGLDPQCFDRSDSGKLSKLATLTGISLSQLNLKADQLTRIDSRSGATRLNRWVKLAEVPEGVYSDIEKLEIQGVYGNLYYERYYPSGTLAAHVLGYVNKNDDPVLGVERMMQFYLEGEDGWKETEGDHRRRELVQFRDREVAARNGYDVVLTIDSVVQNSIEKAIRSLVEKCSPDGVSVVVSDPQTGDILGMGNYPSFDLNAFWKFPIEQQRNRAVTDLYEPGSTFKIVPVAAALEEQLVSPLSTINCSLSSVEYEGRNIRLPSDSHPLGVISVADIVAHSSNRGAAQIGMMLGADRLYQYCHEFGFGEPTDWGLVGEAKGTLHKVKDWDGLTISRLPAGYAVNVTPLQVHFAMSTVANGGKLMQPRLVDRVVDADGQVVLEFPRRIRRQVISEETAGTLAHMLTAVASSEGTARRAEIPGYAVAGKTGTARKLLGEGKRGYSTTEHVASFSGFFPANDPVIAITVVVDNAKTPGVAYGGTVAAPVFREIGESMIDYYAISPAPADDAGAAYAYIGRTR